MILARAIGIWLSGLLACGIVGGMAAEAVKYGSGPGGAIAGLLAFTCIRLWATERREPSKDLPIVRFGQGSGP